MPSTQPPPDVQARRDRLAASGVNVSSVSAAGLAALTSVGFLPVGEVMGAVALRVAPSGFFSGPFTHRPTYPPNWQGDAEGASPPVFTSGHVARVPSRIAAQQAGYRAALTRLTSELRAVGADGAVGVEVRHEIADDGPTEAYERWQFVASGAAVRSSGRVHAAHPFTAAFDAVDFVRALRAGWLPVRYLSCPVAAARWVEPESRRQERRRSDNGEIHAQTEAVNVCRRQAAEDFATAARAVGADAGVMHSMTLHRGPSPDLAEVYVQIVGTAMVRFDAQAASSNTSTILLLGERHDR